MVLFLMGLTPTILGDQTWYALHEIVKRKAASPQSESVAMLLQQRILSKVDKSKTQCLCDLETCTIRTDAQPTEAGFS